MVQSQTDGSPFSSQASSICAAALEEIARHSLCKDEETRTQDEGLGVTSSIGSTIGGRVATRAATSRVLQSQTNPQLVPPAPAITNDDRVCENRMPNSCGGGGCASGPLQVTSKPGGSSQCVGQKRFLQAPTRPNTESENNNTGGGRCNPPVETSIAFVKHEHELKDHLPVRSTFENNNDTKEPTTNSITTTTTTTTATNLSGPPAILDEPLIQRGAPGSCGTSVKCANEWHQDPVWDYRMASSSRGFCLIINNVEFNLDLFEKRKGSDKDAHRFKEIFKQLGFEVDCKRNATAEKMKNAFKQKSTLCTSRHDALVIILLSHGTESGVYGSDGIEVELNDILSYFDNKKCKAMQNKPKVFIVQACRGRRADYGVHHDTQNFFSQPETQLTNTQLGVVSQLTQLNQSQATRLPRWAELDNKLNPTRTDMILCFASQSGYVSTRDEDEGSWLGDSLARYLASEAHQRHLHEILQMVSRDVRKRCSNDGLKQVLEITSIGFDKNLYFNPGLSAPTTTMTRASAARNK